MLYLPIKKNCSYLKTNREQAQINLWLQSAHDFVQHTQKDVIIKWSVMDQNCELSAQNLTDQAQQIFFPKLVLPRKACFLVFSKETPAKEIENSYSWHLSYSQCPTQKPKILVSPQNTTFTLYPHDDL